MAERRRSVQLRDGDGHFEGRRYPVVFSERTARNAIVAPAIGPANAPDPSRGGPGAHAQRPVGRRDHRQNGGPGNESYVRRAGVVVVK